MSEHTYAAALPMQYLRENDNFFKHLGLRISKGRVPGDLKIIFKKIYKILFIIFLGGGGDWGWVGVSGGVWGGLFWLVVHMGGGMTDLNRLCWIFLVLLASSVSLSELEEGKGM